MPSLADSPFAILTFLAAPAILTNASTILALGTSNRLARAADRARLLAGQLLACKEKTDPATVLQSKDFDYALARARLLVRGLRAFYFAAGAFASGTCLSLLGATAAYFDFHALTLVAQALTLVAATAGVGAIVTGAAILVHETRLALLTLGDEQDAIEAWRRRTSA